MTQPQPRERYDRPYRAQPEPGSPEDLRRSLDRTNERINRILKRLEYLEDLHEQNFPGDFPDPSVPQ